MPIRLGTDNDPSGLRRISGCVHKTMWVYREFERYMGDVLMGDRL
jgi:hypothetical protein